MTSPSADLIARLAAEIRGPAHGRRFVLVGVDGPDGAGKTTFADRLTAELRRQPRQVVLVHADDFLNLREVRHRRGPESPEGFWLDSYDYPALERDVLVPFGPEGDGWYRPAATDLRQDVRVHPPARQAPVGTVAVVEGLFLHRDELFGRWDYSVFLDVPFAVTARRMNGRDRTPADPEHPRMRRYTHGQRLYFAACAPWTRATRVIDNRDLDAPRLVPGHEVPHVGRG